MLRPEHNEGVLSSMEEVAMHQDEIGVITNVFESYSPSPPPGSLTFQNNSIEKIQHSTALSSSNISILC
jgi:hypothetical protein